MRYGEVVALTSVRTVQREDGSFTEVRESRGVFANPYSMGATAYMAARSAGLKADAEVQLRTCDYKGEQECVMRGLAYDVERAVDGGEFTTLTLKRRLRDG